MAKIKFSHVYNKLKGADGPVKTAQLLLVIVQMHDDIMHNKAFMDYDTDNGKYTINYANAYLLLVFKKPDGNLFTTVRPQWNDFGNKKPYYDDLIGHQFQIEINSKEVSNG
jgi:thiaminase